MERGPDTRPMKERFYRFTHFVFDHFDDRQTTPDEIKVDSGQLEFEFIDNSDVVSDAVARAMAGKRGLEPR